jgi:hypothetical protein
VELPFHFSGRGVERADCAGRVVTLHVTAATAGERSARFVLGRSLEVDRAISRAA